MAAAAIIPIALQLGQSIGQQVAASRNKAPKTGPPQIINVPPARHADALQSYLSRIYAANVGATPPSWEEFIGSGGTAKFPMQNVRMTPQEASELGFTAPQGGSVPFFDPTASRTNQQGQLDVTQQLYLANQLLQQGRLKNFPYLHQLFTTHQDLFKRAKGLEQKISRHPKQTDRNKTRQQKHDALLDKYFQETGGVSIA